MASLIYRLRLSFLKKPWWKAGEVVVLGVSGGVDSMALLEICNAFSKEFPAKLIAAHVNYHLRGEESDAQEKLVQEVCAKKGIALALADGSEMGGGDSNLQNAARNFRFQFFREVAKKEGSQTILLAHHRDDQVETILLQMLRGAGVTGLSGMAEGYTDSLGCQWLRPLLGLSKKELTEWVAEESISYLEDSSNQKPDYLRNRVRSQLVPLLQELQPKASERILHLGQHARTLKQDFEEKAETVFHQWGFCENGEIIFPRRVLLRLAENTRRHVLRKAYAHFGKGALSLNRDHFLQIDSILSATAPRAEYSLPEGVHVRRSFEELIFERVAIE